MCIAAGAESDGSEDSMAIRYASDESDTDAEASHATAKRKGRKGKKKASSNNENASPAGPRSKGRRRAAAAKKADEVLCLWLQSSNLLIRQSSSTYNMTGMRASKLELGPARSKQS